tara:strand:- start:770 stop:1021 length:252 start_codon:yes stop_codon:yes gene_type:complete
MTFFVYIIKSISGKIRKTYVGYTINIDKRLNAHNNNKGAKSTKGYKWKLIYKKKFKSKSDAMKYEYYLKKNRKEKLKIMQKID